MTDVLGSWEKSEAWCQIQSPDEKRGVGSFASWRKEIRCFLLFIFWFMFWWRTGHDPSGYRWTKGDETGASISWQLGTHLSDVCCWNRPTDGTSNLLHNSANLEGKHWTGREEFGNLSFRTSHPACRPKPNSLLSPGGRVALEWLEGWVNGWGFSRIQVRLRKNLAQLKGKRLTVIPWVIQISLFPTLHNSKNPKNVFRVHNANIYILAQRETKHCFKEMPANIWLELSGDHRTNCMAWKRHVLDVFTRKLGTVFPTHRSA